MSIHQGQGESKNKTKLPCTVCEKSNKTNSICVQCKKPFCLQHSTFCSANSPERTCDDCLENSFLSDLPDSETTIEAISEEIQRIVNEREELTQNLCKLSASFMHRKTELETSLKSMQAQEESLVNKIKESKESLKIAEDACSKKSKEIDQNKHDLEFAKSKAAANQKEIDSTSAKISIATRERNLISQELNELKEFIKLQVPIRLVKRIVCSTCFSRVVIQYQGIFKPQAANEKKASIKHPPKKMGACSSCEIS